MKIKYFLSFLMLTVLATANKMPEVWKPFNAVIDTLTNNTVEFRRYLTEQQEKATNTFRNYYEKMSKLNDDITAIVNNHSAASREDSKPKIMATALPLSTPNVSSTGTNEAHIFLNVPGSIAVHGYKSESHTLVTEDGYVLTVHRIPRSNKLNFLPKKTVLLQHGIFGSSADWTMAGPQRSLAYILSDNGYDVWMANLRGNTYSRQHSSLKPDSKEFWDFTWHEAALYDLPAYIQYIKEFKGDCEIHYVGHSMGSTMLMTLLAERPQFNTKFKSAILLSPVIYMSDIKGPLSFLKTLSTPKNEFTKLFDSYELKPATIFMKILSQTSCDLTSIDRMACQNAMFSFSGFDEEQMEPDLLPIITAHSPAGVSSKTLIHYTQEISAGGKFQKFDYGPQKNTELYGSETCPEYNIDDISLPIAVIWAKNDWISGKVDVEKFFNKLKHPIEFYTIPDERFNHIDFLWAKAAPELVYSKIVNLLKEIDP